MYLFFEVASPDNISESQVADSPVVKNFLILRQPRGGITRDGPYPLEIVTSNESKVTSKVLSVPIASRRPGYAHSGL